MSPTGLGLNSSATMMFGHVETVEDRIEHLERVRAQQDKSKGFTAFICWTFQAEHTKLRAPTVGAHEYLRTQALARIYLDNFPSVQSSWVTQGQEIGQVALKFGANDLGSIMIEENVVSQAGTTFRMSVADMRRLISELGYEPHQRDNWYRLLSTDGGCAAESARCRAHCLAPNTLSRMTSLVFQSSAIVMARGSKISTMRNHRLPCSITFRSVASQSGGL